ncbi:ribosome maturation factor RimM [Candidatus Eisenbacteria bacterium]|uniref:Ribosome maturation factor RimM n=1 Tax=Eiseniibacteriota bacterium TaxID=2212470 RepID=A0ABV6YJE5_UNCEI
MDVGKIGKPFGLKGEAVIHYYADDPDRFRPGKDVFAVSADGHRKLTVATARRVSKKYVVRFDGFERIEDIKPWVNRTLQVRACDLPQLAGDAAYHFELIGLRVHAADGLFLGVLEEVIETPGNDVYCVRAEGRELLIPAIRDAIDKVDVEAGTMVLKDMEGLIDP